MKENKKVKSLYNKAERIVNKLLDDHDTHVCDTVIHAVDVYDRLDDDDALQLVVLGLRYPKLVCVKDDGLILFWESEEVAVAKITEILDEATKALDNEKVILKKQAALIKEDLKTDTKGVPLIVKKAVLKEYLAWEKRLSPRLVDVFVEPGFNGFRVHAKRKMPIGHAYEILPGFNTKATNAWLKGLATKVEAKK